MTDIRVLKFGGTSLGAPDRVLRAATIIAAERALGPVAVVVSAMGGTTNALLAAAAAAASGDEQAARAQVDAVQELVLTHAGLADAPEAVDTILALVAELRKLLYGVSLLREHSAASLDLILSFGERLSATAMAALLTSRGTPALMVDARTFVHTDARFGDAIVDWPRTAAALADAHVSWGDAVPVVTGFLGQAPDGRTTTLGRNGSDYTATLLGRGLGATEVQIWTDVEGVMTADPALVDEAYPLSQMSYGEALELATFGARMFHPRTMIPLIESGIPMRIRSTMAPEAAGTRVDAHGATDTDRATSVTSLEGQALLDVQVRQLNHATQVGERVQAVLLAEKIPVWMMTQSAMGQAISAVIPQDDADRALTALEDAFSRELERGDLHPIGLTRPVTLLTLVAEAMGRTPNVAGRMFATLGEVGVNVLAIGQSASSRSVSCVIHARDTTHAVRGVHTGFNLTHQRASVFMLGSGVVGSEFLSQVREQRAWLRDQQDVDLLIVGVATSRRLAFDPSGLDLEAWREALLTVDDDARGPLGPVTLDVLDQLARLTGPVLVDCTASDGMEALYEAAFARGIHVVAANKKPLTTRQARRDGLLASARAHHRSYRYETTVGASLPVIATLQDLVQTGDTVERIEGSFSGTLGYLTNALMDGQRIDVAVREAKRLGFTEPLPQDDLSGLDAARKAIILARELGYQIEMEEVALTPLVPAELLAERDLDAFFTALAGHADTVAAEIVALKAEGKVLRYLATVDPSGPARQAPLLTVGPTVVAADHPAARLRGSESFVSFQTRRYQAYPLVVQGAGAGGAVTAAGVLADVLRLFMPRGALGPSRGSRKV